MDMKHRAAHSLRRLASMVLAVVAAGVAAQTATAASPTVDQEQPTINVGMNFPIGGFFDQNLAQSVTARQSGRLTEVRLPIYCTATGELTVRIEGWAGTRPDGNVLASETFPGASLPFFPGFPDGVVLRSFPLSAPPTIQAGRQFAVVAAGTGCAIFPGPVGDPYPGGDAYYRDVDNPWSCLCGFPGFGYGSDLPFATLVERLDATPPVLTVPGGVAVDATAPGGAVVSFTASASDDVDGPLPVTCVPPTGSSFPIGSTTVSCSATDGSGNSASASFVVRAKGAAEQLGDLAGVVAGVGAGTSLADKVADARAALAAGKRTKACETLGAFRNEVSAQSGKSLSPPTATALATTAARIQAVLAC